MIITDGTKTVEILMFEDDKPDYSMDFFEAGNLDIVNRDDIDNQGVEPIYRVDDVDYCIDYAKMWMTFDGEYTLEKTDLEKMGLPIPERSVMTFNL